MTNLSMNALKQYFDDSVFLIGKNKVMQIALNSNEQKENAAKLNSYLKGNCLILISKFVYSYFDNIVNLYPLNFCNIYIFFQYSKAYRMDYYGII